MYNRGSRFLDFWDFRSLTTEFRLAKTKTKVERAFFFIFMSSYAEMSVWAQKSLKIFNSNMGIKKSEILH
jgi:hypothetical protein